MDDIESMDSVEVLKLIQDDKYTAKHCWRTAYYAELIAKELKLNEIDVHLVREAALIHDVGKIGVERSTLLKPSSLNEEEWNDIEGHPMASAAIATHLNNSPSIIQIIAQHHEQPDGLGYPHGLKAKQIDLKAAILRVADAFDAMTTNRPYSKAKTIKEAVKELKDSVGTKFEEKAVKALEAIVKREPTKKQIEL